LNSFKKILDFILFGNLYVAIGTICLIQSTHIQLGNSGHLFFYSLLTFFSTLFVYNFQRVFYKPQKDISLHSIRRRWIFENQPTIKTVCLIGFSGVAITFFYNDPKIIFYLSPLLILSLAYFVPSVKLRKSPWFKLLTLVIVWTMATAVVPILLSHSDLFTKNNILHIVVRFSFMMAICIPFDIRDLKIDEADHISTLPHLIGENKTRMLAVAFMFVYILLIIVEFYWMMFDAKIFAALMISALINTMLVFSSSSKRSEYFYVAGIDGTMILQGVMLMIAQSF
jgi:1,4-dihydroxy-2-naphthoate octaprenyltransferase